MKSRIINKIKSKMKLYLDENQLVILDETLRNVLKDFDLVEAKCEFDVKQSQENSILLMNFLASKHVEGCSERTIRYYHSTIDKMLNVVNKKIEFISTDDLRKYLADYKDNNNASKTTIDNVRRVLSSFFSWLEDEDYILKNPVRRIRKIKTKKVVKEVISDENFEILRDSCSNVRDLAMIELLASTGIRVGELVNLNIDDVLFNERECVVLGKGDSERIVYFDAKTKIHLLKYLENRTDNNPALFVSFKKPYKRLGINGVERRIRE